MFGISSHFGQVTQRIWADLGRVPDMKNKKAGRRLKLDKSDEWNLSLSKLKLTARQVMDVSSFIIEKCNKRNFNTLIAEKTEPSFTDMK